MNKLILALIALAALSIASYSADIQIRWSDPNPLDVGVTKYRVYQLLSGTTNTVRKGETSNRFYNIAGLTNGTYKYRITAVNIWGEGNYYTNSSEATVTITLPGPVTNAYITNWVR